jgi:hypothetical protein
VARSSFPASKVVYLPMRAANALTDNHCTRLVY